MELREIFEAAARILSEEDRDEQTLEERRETIGPYEDFIAEQLGIVPIMGGWTVAYGPMGCSRIDVMRMAFNWRITESPLPDQRFYSRHWCYDHSGGLKGAVEAARAWGGEPQEEPGGWIKAWDQRIGGRLAEEYLERRATYGRKLPIVPR